jgi:hypothetical protein
VNRPLPSLGGTASFDGLITIFNLLPVFTDVDLLLLDQTSYFSRCLCSGFFLPEIKRGAMAPRVD